MSSVRNIEQLPHATQAKLGPACHRGWKPRACKIVRDTSIHVFHAKNGHGFPGVFNNDKVDGSFGVTSPIFLDDITSDGKLLNTVAVDPLRIVTSFSSKSELALNRSLDKKVITFVGYVGSPGFVTGPNQLDVSNSNTPGVVDPTNPVKSEYYRSVGEDHRR